MNLNGRSMTASEYYYGVSDPTYWDKMLYFEALKDRAERAKQLYFKLYKMGSKVQSFDDKVRFFKVEKAMRDTKQLVDERTVII